MPNGYLCKNIPAIRLTYGICILIVNKKKKKKNFQFSSVHCSAGQSSLFVVSERSAVVNGAAVK
jgi:hypothetical protein